LLRPLRVTSLTPPSPRADGDETIGKVATGITDEEPESLHERLRPHARSESGTEVKILPAVVFEVGREEIQRSPTCSSGHAPWFPRFVAVRGDEEPADADSPERAEQVERPADV